MLVKMLVDTNYRGLKKANDIVEIEDAVAKRWINNGLAEVANKVENPYEGMKAKELYDLCIEKGIEVEQKKSRDVYIAALNAVE